MKNLDLQFRRKGEGGTDVWISKNCHHPLCYLGTNYNGKIIEGSGAWYSEIMEQVLSYKIIYFEQKQDP